MPQYAPITLRGPRVLLRNWRDEDLAPFARLAADPGVMQHLIPLPDRAASDALAQRIRNHMDSHGFGFWAVELPGIARFIGFTGLAHVPFEAPFTPAVEVGWRLDSAFWGQGYATEAATLALNDGFARLNLDQVVAFTVPANDRSWRVMERLGMTRNPDDDFDHPRLPEGHPLRRHLLYRLRRNAWMYR